MSKVEFHEVTPGPAGGVGHRLEAGRPMDSLITAKEAARILRLSYRTVCVKANRREIRHIRDGRRILFRREHLEHYKREREVGLLGQMGKEVR
jgi:excisionase family DNA binding protein